MATNPEPPVRAPKYGSRKPGGRLATRIRTVGLITLVLYALAWVGLPLALAARGRPISRGANPHAMTVGCEKASCCTSRCWVDENGVHHCVPAKGEGCDCGLISPEETSTLAFAEDIQIPPNPPGEFLPGLPPAGFIHEERAAAGACDLPVPTPPPR